MREHGDLEKVRRIDVVQRNLREDVGANGHESVRRIEAVPVSGRRLGQKPQPEIAEAPHRGHVADGGEVAEAVPFGVIGLAAQERLDEARRELERHLPVTVDLDDDVGAVGEGLAETADHGAAHAAISIMPNDADARVDGGAARGDGGGVVGRCVVDHDGRGEQRRQLRQHRGQVRAHVVRRNDRGDAWRGHQRRSVSRRKSCSLCSIM